VERVRFFAGVEDDDDPLRAEMNLDERAPAAPGMVLPDTAEANNADDVRADLSRVEPMLRRDLRACAVAHVEPRDPQPPHLCPPVADVSP